MCRSRVLIAVAISAVVSANALGADSQVTTLAIQGMTCPACPITVTKLLKRVPGVSEAAVDGKTQLATIRFDPEKAQPEQLAKAVTAIGFPTVVR